MIYNTITKPLTTRLVFSGVWNRLCRQALLQEGFFRKDELIAKLKFYDFPGQGGFKNLNFAY